MPRHTKIFRSIGQIVILLAPFLNLLKTYFVSADNSFVYSFINHATNQGWYVSFFYFFFLFFYFYCLLLMTDILTTTLGEDILKYILELVGSPLSYFALATCSSWYRYRVERYHHFYYYFYRIIRMNDYPLFLFCNIFAILGNHVSSLARLLSCVVQLLKMDI